MQLNITYNVKKHPVPIQQLNLEPYPIKNINSDNHITDRLKL